MSNKAHFHSLRCSYRPATQDKQVVDLSSGKRKCNFSNLEPSSQFHTDQLCLEGRDSQIEGKKREFFDQNRGKIEGIFGGNEGIFVNS